MKYFLHLTITLILLSNNQVRIRGNLHKHTTPVIIDTVKVERIQYQEIWLGSASYAPFYIGKKLDTLFVSHHFELSSLHPELPLKSGPNDFDEKKYSYDEQYRNYKTPSIGEISLFVDTSSIISNQIVFADSITETGLTLVLLADKCYPVIIENNTKDTLKIGHAYTLLLILEAKDKNDVWKPIEKFNWYWGPENKGVFIPPSQIAVACVKINKGKFETKLRLRYDSILSNEFNGSIYLTQFESEYDEKGNRKLVPKD